MLRMHLLSKILLSSTFANLNVWQVTPLYKIRFSAYPIRERMVQVMDMEKIVCNCTGVTCERIKAAIDSGAATLEEVQEATGASTVCGACLEEVEALIAHFKAERDTP